MAVATAMSNSVAGNTADDGRTIPNGRANLSAECGRSDWQLAKALAIMLVRRPKSGFLSLWVLVYVPVMTAMQDYERGALFDVFILLTIAFVAGLAPVFVVWSPSALRALSCSTAVIRQARLVVALVFGLIVLLLFGGILWWKLDPGATEFWGAVLVAALIQCAVYIHGWREAEKIEDAVTRQERLKRESLEKRADKQSKNSIDQSGKTVVGVTSALGRALSSGDALLDELALKSWISGLKWFVLPMTAISFGAMFLAYVIHPDPHEPFTWAQWIIAVVVLNAPMVLAASYNSQIIRWLAFSGSRSQWWHNHLKLTAAHLWVGPLLVVAALGGYVAGVSVRNVEPVVTWNLKTVAAALVIGLCGQLLLMGLSNAILLGVNRLRGWKIAAAFFILYAAASAGVAAVVMVLKDRAGEIASANGGAINPDHLVWTMGWQASLMSLVITAVLWALAAWGYRHLNVCDSDDIDFFGTSQ